MLFCHLLIFFSKSTFSIFFRGIPFECQTDLIQIRPDVLSGLFWVQSVCKGYEQTTLVGKWLTYDTFFFYISLFPFAENMALSNRNELKPVHKQLFYLLFFYSRPIDYLYPTQVGRVGIASCSQIDCFNY